jgi:hypothetical protein
MNEPGTSSLSNTITLHLQAGTTRAEAEAIADTLHSKVKALCYVQAEQDTAR